MTTEQTIDVVERMRELLADPDRVVLNPMHYFERVDDQTVVELDWDQAQERRDTCRVCFCGAASMAALEAIERAGAEDDDDQYTIDEDVRHILRRKALDLGIPLDEEVARAYPYGEDEPIVVLTSALKQGRAVEVVDAVLADLRAVTA